MLNTGCWITGNHSESNKQKKQDPALNSLDYSGHNGVFQKMGKQKPRILSSKREVLVHAGDSETLALSASISTHDQPVTPTAAGHSDQEVTHTSPSRCSIGWSVLSCCYMGLYKRLSSVKEDVLTTQQNTSLQIMSYFLVSCLMLMM